MNWSEIQGDWERFKRLPQSYWRRLNEEDLLQIDGSRATLAAILRGRYRFGLNEVEDAIASFERDVRLPGAVK